MGPEYVVLHKGGFWVASPRSRTGSQLHEIVITQWSTVIKQLLVQMHFVGIGSAIRIIISKNRTYETCPSWHLLLFSAPSTGLNFSRGACVELATHPLHNNDGFCLHLPVFLLSASPAELQLFQCQPWHQRGALPHWHGEDDQVEDLPGLPAILPPHLQLHPLPGAPGQPRRAHLKGTSPAAFCPKCVHLQFYTLRGPKGAFLVLKRTFNTFHWVCSWNGVVSCELLLKCLLKPNVSLFER